MYFIERSIDSVQDLDLNIKFRDIDPVDETEKLEPDFLSRQEIVAKFKKKEKLGESSDLSFEIDVCLYNAEVAGDFSFQDFERCQASIDRLRVTFSVYW